MESFAGADGMRPWLIAVVVSMAVLSVAFVALRLIGRRLMRQRMWWDDWMILISSWNLLCVVLIIAMYAEGLGLHELARENDHAVLVAKLLIATQILCAWTLCLTKTSILLMYHRAFDLRIGSRMYLIILAGLVLAWGITATFISVFICAPHKHWYPHSAGTCLNQTAVWITSAALTVFTDLAILLFPVPYLRGLQLDLREKTAMTLVFVMGFFVVGVSTYRISMPFFFQDDGRIVIIGWSEIEIAAALVAACLPMLHPILSIVLRATGLAEGEVVFLSGSSLLKKLSFDDGRVSPGTPVWWRTGTTSSSKRWTQDRGGGGSYGGVGFGGEYGRPCGGRMGFVGASNSEVLDWQREVEAQTRQRELSMFQHRASASRSSDAGISELPMCGISVTRDFRRFSEIDPVRMGNMR